MNHIKAKILSNLQIAPCHYKMVLDNLNISTTAKPGQFLYIRCENDYDPLLRRPFSIHRISDQKPEYRNQITEVRGPKSEVGKQKNQKQDAVEILYKVVGKGTEILSEKKAGKSLDIIGPLGNGFNLTSDIRHLSSVILVSGGMGVAPLMFLAETLVKDYKLQGTTLIGARTKELILCEKEFEKLGIDVKVSTEDGSYGYKGLATDLFENLLLTIPASSAAKRREGRGLANVSGGNHRLSTIIYACGPKPMLKKVAEISRAKGIPCQVSLEENMGCGIGVCLGCVVKTKKGYKRICRDGPVFDVEEIEWRSF